MHISEEALDNELVKQKNMIIKMINEDRILEAQSMIEVVTPMWIACDYGYKVKELIDRIDLA